ncbi:probable histone-lysine N-methyltransferase CG1716 [Agrilus planipennis]|uniref:[histone H3]-lysine(36) N-trimethyltransferase n=1 Tax=Agrilus planipennis TaxID=224129 RepID=A0A1W4WFY1_AGRPL|nr:probable histone-lysine N-methyltransferase CG1716 [Agrilus planipennis]
MEHEEVQTKGKNQEKKKQRNVRKIDKKPLKVPTKAALKEFKMKKTSDKKKEGIQEKTKVRRSTRIKSIGTKQTQKTDKSTINSKGMAKNKKGESDSSDGSNSGNNELEKLSTENSNISTVSVNNDTEQKPVKVKSRWRRSSELEMGANKNNDNDKNSSEKILTPEEEIKIRLKQFVHLKDNSYLTDRVCCKEAKKMVCDCFLTQEEVDRGDYGCGEDCLNRLLMIECGPLCSLGDRCTNKRFQKSKQSACEVFRTEKKGLGIRATKIIPDGEFILEYVGEVINPDEFEDRATEYSKGKNSHFYFMALRSDAVIDATQKGNISRFINHSCEPNAETQKWTVNGELRIGFFSKKTIQVGEEITFDYHFQRYGKEAQKCYCEAPSCRGWLGEEPDDEDEEEAEEMEEEEEEKEETEDEESVDKKKDEGDKTSKLRKDVVVKQKVKKSLKDEGVKEDSVLTDEPKLGTETPEKVKSKEEKSKIINKVKTPKSKPNKILQKTRKELFDDSDLNEEIQTLMSTGLKNQAHTLKLSRLMVRATEITQKSNLLRVLRRGEFPCRRLFLDYHGLRLIHGWMTDAQRYCKTDMKQESLRLEILQTLATLPIPNKTMLQDSKVLLTVEKWSLPLKKDDELDSDSNSPKLENEEKEEDEFGVEETQNKTDSKLVETMEVIVDIKAKEVKEEKKEGVEEFEIRKSVGMDHESIVKDQDKSVSSLLEKITVSHFANLFEDDILDIIEKEVERATKPEVPEYEVEIVALALKLLEEWSTLKEVFRIPKKERIERMKEHEREANRGYKPTLENDLERKHLNRYRQLQRPSRFDIELRMRKPFPILDQRNLNPFKYNKHERRKLFALQVEQEEEKRRKMHSFIKQEVAILGPDLRLGPQHDVKFQYMWNPQTGQWQKVQILNQNPTSVGQTPPQKQAMVPHPPPILQNLNQPAARLPYPFNSYSASLNSNSHSQLSSFPPVQPNVPQVSHYPPIITSTGMPSMLQHTNRLPDIQSSNLLPPQGISVPLPGNPPLPVIPPLPNTTTDDKIEDASQVRFAGPIPPPVKLPPKWKCAKDIYGRPYYYHVKIRISQWEPPDIQLAEDSEDESSETTSSSDSSSLSSESSCEESDSDEDEVDDTKLMIEIKKNLKNMETKLISEQDDSNSKDDIQQKVNDPFQSEKKPSLEERLKVEFNFLKNEKDKEPPVKRRRSGLVTEIHIISPRTEEDKILAKENLKKYKDNKEKLKRQKEVLLKKAKQSKETAGEQPKKRIRVTVKSPKHKKHKEKEKLTEVDNETAKKIKENFRSSMASVMVNILNPFRKPDCKEGHISNNEDFKHLARKLTHFVMLKELKHCKSIEDLTCTDSVKNKAKEFVRKYMAKFGEKYVRPKDEMDF